MKLRSLLMFLAVVSTAACADVKAPAPIDSVPAEIAQLKHGADLIQKQRDDLASELLNANVQIQLLAEQLQAAKATATPVPVVTPTPVPLKK